MSGKRHKREAVSGAVAEGDEDPPTEPARVRDTATPVGQEDQSGGIGAARDDEDPPKEPARVRDTATPTASEDRSGGIDAGEDDEDPPKEPARSVAAPRGRVRETTHREEEDPLLQHRLSGLVTQDLSR
jgi:hypothetical protein